MLLKKKDVSKVAIDLDTHSVFGRYVWDDGKVIQ